MRNLLTVLLFFALALGGCDDDDMDSCGDNVVDPGEQCDGSDHGGDTCQSLGMWGGTLGCTAQCTFDTTLCEGSCGDGAIDDANEECDGANLGNATCASLDMGSGTLACNTDCAFDYSGCETCGDGNVQTEAGEACDGDNLNGTTCGDLGYFAGTLACDAGCGFNTDDCLEMVQLAAGGSHTCGIDALDNVWCWGEGSYGQLGDGKSGTSQCGMGIYCRNTPVKVETNGLPGFAGFYRIAAGYNHTCAMDRSHNVWCWGQGDMGELGVTMTDSDCAPDFCKYTPVKVELSMEIGESITDISAGGSRADGGFTCVLTSLSNLYCWGANQYGQLALPDPSPDSCDWSGAPTACAQTPVLTYSFLESMASVFSGGAHSCAVSDGGTPYCWGINDYSNLGIEYTPGSCSSERPCQPTPTAMDLSMITGSTDFSTMVPGQYHTCGSTDEGQAWCVGGNGSGQLGDNSFTSADFLVRVDETGLDTDVGIFQVTSGHFHACGVDMSDQLWCWGGNDFGELGNGAETGSREWPQQVIMDNIPQGTGFSRIACGESHCCTLAFYEHKGGVWCWGQGEYGATGLGSASNATQPTKVAFPTTP